MGWDSYLHLFAVNVQTGAVSEVISKYVGFEKGPILWERSDGEMFVPTDNGMVLRMAQIEGKWKEVGHSVRPQLKNGVAQDVIIGTNLLVGINEDVRTPPDLFVYDTKTAEVVLLTDLNPEYRDVSLGKIETVHWTNKYGVRCEGQLM